MSMYLPNPGLQPTGQEPAEFIDAHRAGSPGDRRAGDPPPARARPPLDARTRLELARRAGEYVAGLVERRDGGPDDLRAILRDLATVVDTSDGSAA